MKMHPAFTPLPLGSIRPRGRLGRQLQIQADGLTGHLDEVWADVRDSAWIGGSGESWERGPAHRDPWPVFIALKALTQFAEATGNDSAGHVVLDMAMSQFSYGRLGAHAKSGEPLPVVGCVDASGEPTTDAKAIFDGGRVLPMGYWKGSGLALLLDLIAALVSGGKTTREIADLDPRQSESQVFAAIDLSHLNEAEFHNAVVDGAVAANQGPRNRRAELTVTAVSPWSGSIRNR